jgi:hypothetical protein
MVAHRQAVGRQRALTQRLEAASKTESGQGEQNSGLTKLRTVEICAFHPVNPVRESGFLSNKDMM